MAAFPQRAARGACDRATVASPLLGPGSFRRLKWGGVVASSGTSVTEETETEADVDTLIDEAFAPLIDAAQQR